MARVFYMSTFFCLAVLCLLTYVYSSLLCSFFLLLFYLSDNFFHFFVSDRLWEPILAITAILTSHSMTPFWPFKLVSFSFAPSWVSQLQVLSSLWEDHQFSFSWVNQPAFQVSPWQVVSLHPSTACGQSLTTLLSFHLGHGLFLLGFTWAITLVLLLPLLQETGILFPSIVGPLPFVAALLGLPVHSFSFPWGIPQFLSPWFWFGCPEMHFSHWGFHLS